LDLHQYGHLSSFSEHLKQIMIPQQDEFITFNGIVLQI